MFPRLKKLNHFLTLPITLVASACSPDTGNSVLVYPPACILADDLGQAIPSPADARSYDNVLHQRAAKAIGPWQEVSFVDGVREVIRSSRPVTRSTFDVILQDSEGRPLSDRSFAYELTQADAKAGMEVPVLTLLGRTDSQGYAELIGTPFVAQGELSAKIRLKGPTDAAAPAPDFARVSGTLDMTPHPTVRIIQIGEIFESNLSDCDSVKDPNLTCDSLGAYDHYRDAQLIYLSGGARFSCGSSIDKAQTTPAAAGEIDFIDDQGKQTDCASIEKLQDSMDCASDWSIQSSETFRAQN